MTNQLNNIAPAGNASSPTTSHPQPHAQPVGAVGGSAFGRTISGAPPSYDSVMASDSSYPVAANNAPSLPTAIAQPVSSHRTNAELPPAYTPVDCSSLLDALPIDAEPDYQTCLDTLSIAYRFDLAALADAIRSGYCPRGLHEPTEIMTYKLIGPNTVSRKIPELESLAERLFVLFKAGWRDMRFSGEKNRLAFILCLYFLEQKAQLVTSALKKDSVDKKAVDKKADDVFIPNPAALVRKEFFQLFNQFTERDNVAIGELPQKIQDFLADDELAALRDDLDCEVPISSDARFSQLRYQDIPGAVPQPKLRPQLDNYSRTYGINFFDLVDTIGDVRELRNGLPIQYLTCQLLTKQNPGFDRRSLKREQHFKDRNAKFIITALDHYHAAAFATSDALAPSETKRKQPYPVQESSASEQKKAEIMQNFMQFLLDGLKAKGMNNVRQDLTKFMAINWPERYIPAAYRGGKMP